MTEKELRHYPGEDMKTYKHIHTHVRERERERKKDESNSPENLFEIFKLNRTTRLTSHKFSFFRTDRLSSGKCRFIPVLKGREPKKQRQQQWPGLNEFNPDWYEL